MTAAFITLLCALVLAAAVIVIQARKISWLKEAGLKLVEDAKELVENSRELMETNKAYRHANEDEKPHFAIGVQLPGRKISVDRISFQNGVPYTATLKVFDDEDNEFNLQEAQELLEALQD